MRYSIIIIIFLGWAFSPCFGGTIARKLSVRFSYQDLYLSCVKSHQRYIGFNFNGSVKDGEVTKAYLSNMADPTMRVAFLPEELKGIEVSSDTLGDFEINKLPLSARLLNWIVYNVDLPMYFLACKPLKKLATLGPNSHTFVFARTTGIERTAAVQRFHGDLSDGTPYSMKLGFYQNPIKIPIQKP